jgi:hypothetical protein
MKRLKMVVLSVIVSLMVSTSVSAGILEESVALDRAYVPALALTNQKDKALTMIEESMRRLEVAWDRFVRNMRAGDQAGTFNQAVAFSTAKISEAKDLVAADKRKEAHEALETVRLTFRKARIAANIDYLPDRFTAFHEPMEELAGLATKEGVDAAGLRKRLQQLSSLWGDIEKAGFDAKLFGVGTERAAKYEDQVRKEREILARLDDIIGSQNKETVAKMVISMKGNFAQTYVVFGDFTGLQ